MPIVFRSPPTVLQFFNNAGQPNAGGSVLTQVGGVNMATYSDAGSMTPLPNPIPLNSRGEISTATGASSELFLIQGMSYTFTLYDANANQIGVYPNIVGINDPASATITPSTYNPGTTVGAQLANLGSGTGANNVGYTPPFPGSVATNVGAKLAQTVSLTDFAGSDPSGATDSSGALVAALSWASLNDIGTLNVPAGKFKIASTVTFPALPAFRIVGVGGKRTAAVGNDGHPTSSVFLNYTGGVMFTIPIVAVTYDTGNVNFEHIGFDQTASASGTAVQLNSGYDQVQFLGCGFYGGTYGLAGVTVAGSPTFNIKVQDCNFFNITNSAVYFPYIAPLGTTDYLNMEFRGNVFRFNGWALNFGIGHSVYTYNNLVEANNTGGYLLDGVSTILMVGDHFEQNAVGGAAHYDVRVTNTNQSSKNLNVLGCTFTADSPHSQAVQFRLEYSGKSFFAGNSFNGTAATASLQISEAGGTFFTEIQNQFDTAYTVSGPTQQFVLPYQAVAYTPAWTASVSNPVLGNGTISGYYFLIGNLCTAFVTLTTGTTTTYGSGTYYFSLPFTINNTYFAGMTAYGTGDWANVGVADYPVTPEGAANSPKVLLFNDANGAIVSPTVPYTLVSGKTVGFQITFPV